jgi:sec-independent protein translocase protein TatB
MVTPPTIEIANLGMADSLILMVLALVVFGPRRLPQIGRQIGKLMYEFRKASNDFKFQMEEELRSSEEADRRKQEEERLKTLALAAPAAQAAPTDETGSQPSESRSRAPGIEAGTTTVIETPYQNPYPEEAGNPYPEEAAPAAEAPAQVIYPLIQPPATGEMVQAERPHAQVGAIPEPGPAPDDAHPEQNGPATEQVHHA